MAAIGNVAVVGLGIMGGAIARNLAAAGFRVSGFDIDSGRAAAAASFGVAVRGSAAEAARDADLVLTSLPSVAALDDTVTSLVAEPRPGLIVAELSTLPIQAKETARDRLATVGIVMLDCPLSGTGAQAVTRDLALYGSGDEPAFARCREAFSAVARVSHYLGAFGNGSRMKFVANLLVAVHNVAAAEALVLGTKAGLDPERISRGHRQRRRHLAHLRIARSDDGEGRLHPADGDDACVAEGQCDHRRIRSRARRRHADAGGRRAAL
jgi:putative dehydrogenase